MVDDGTAASEEVTALPGGLGGRHLALRASGSARHEAEETTASRSV